jgi:hypothetical protein
MPIWWWVYNSGNIFKILRPHFFLLDRGILLLPMHFRVNGFTGAVANIDLCREAGTAHRVKL